MKSSSHSRRKPALLFTLLCGAALGLSACNDANTALASPITVTPPPVTPVTPAPAKAARVEIVQTGLLFTTSGQTRQLSARVFDATGVAINVPVRWSSSDAANITVNSDGLASAARATGSSQIVAMVDTLRSAPLLAVVTAVAPGTVLVSDAQVIRGVAETDPNAAPSLANTYTVVLSGIELPAVGTLMAGTGSEPVAGRVVTSRVVAGGVEVTLKPAPLPELFPGLEINQRFDLSALPVTVPTGVSDSYDVVREGSTYRFTPRAQARAQSKTAFDLPSGTRQLFKGCEGSVNGAGFGDGAAPPFVFEPQPVFSFTISPALDVIYTEARGLERFVVTAEPTFLIDGTIKATVAFEGKITCKAELLLFTVPVGGALSVVISGLVPVGVGFEVAGKLTVAQMKLGFASRTSARAAIGIACDGECKAVNELTDFVNTNTPTIDIPGEEDFRVKPEVSAFGFVEARIGNRFFRSLQFKAFEVKAGPKLEGEFAPIASQLAATDFKASYKLSLGVNAGFGDDIEKVLNILGVVKVGDEVLELTTDLANSPTGMLTTSRERFATGDTVPFQLTLDQPTSAFLGFYNVAEVVLIRNNDTPVEVARLATINGQTTFNFSFIAPDAGETRQFSAFVVTRFTPANVLSLELDTARVTNTAPVAANDTLTVDQNSAATTVLVLANDRDADGDTLQISSVVQPASGVVTIGNGGQVLSYRPAPAFVGSESFSYTVIDGRGGSAQATVTVTVRPVFVKIRLTSAFVGSRADATACPNVRPGNCASPAPLIEERRSYDSSTGIPAGDRSSAESAAVFNNLRVDVSTRGGFSAAVAEENLQIDLNCDTTGTASQATRDGTFSYGGSSSSRSSVDFQIDGEGALRYRVTVLGSNASSSGAGEQSNASVRGNLGDAFELRHNSRDGASVEGNDSGVLEAGGYSFSLICVGTLPGEGGQVSTQGGVRLELMR